MPDQRSATTRHGRRLTYAVQGTGPLLVCHPGGPCFDGGYFEDLGGELEAARAREGELFDGIPDSRLAIIEDSGHFHWVEKPERFRAAVVPFLSP